ncbi:phosphate ABC transporter permease PstA [Humidisolicoccus flavus]|uniref:phosphate ABC transporter permease PstA n=1 Tax=Humidisolicoccus flavus TaxID=3111414 RepID=UPI00324B2830
MAINTTSKPQSASSSQVPSTLTSGQLPKWAPFAIFIACLAVIGTLFFLISLASGEPFNLTATLVISFALFLISLTVISNLIEGSRRATDRLVTGVVIGAFALAVIPLISLITTVVINGVARFDPMFFSHSMRNVVGEGGGAVHAIVGTLLVTLWAAIISVPIGIFTAIYLVEYGRGALARGITFFVDVMTGIPSIVAGLFAYALFSIFFGPGIRMGFGGSVALSLLMIPVVVRSTEEMLKIVPNELREASYALGVPKWLTIVKVVLPTALAGIATGVTLAVARVIGETAPLLLIAGLTASMNYDAFNERMTTLPVFVYTQYMNTGVDVAAYHDRAWAGALTLILIVMALNLIARLVAKIFSPKTGR